MKLLTVITPVFNGEKFIEETIKSVLCAAKGLDFEYLIIDDGSTDGTGKIVEKYKNDLTYIYKQNSGQAKAINEGISIASGEYMSIVNCDDPLASEAVFKDAIEVLTKHDYLVGTYPDWNIINENGEITERKIVEDFSYEEMIGKFNCLIGPGGVFRSSSAKLIGGWNPDFRFVPDYDFWLRLLKYGNFMRIPKIQANWRTHENSISISSKGVAMADERIKVITNHLDRSENLPRTLRRMALGYAYYNAAILSHFDSKVKGRQLIIMSIVTYPKLLLKINLFVGMYIIFLPISKKLYLAASKNIDRIDLENNIKKKVRIK